MEATHIISNPEERETRAINDDDEMGFEPTNLPTSFPGSSLFSRNKVTTLHDIVRCNNH